MEQMSVCVTFWSHILNICSIIYLCTSCYMIRLPCLFTAWRFWTVHNKSHNMKDLVIQSHSWSLFLPLICLYEKWKNKHLWISVWISGVFSWEKTPPRLPMQITSPWPPVGRFWHCLITVRQKKIWKWRG